MMTNIVLRYPIARRFETLPMRMDQGNELPMGLSEASVPFPGSQYPAKHIKDPGGPSPSFPKEWHPNKDVNMS